MQLLLHNEESGRSTNAAGNDCLRERSEKERGSVGQERHEEIAA